MYDKEKTMDRRHHGIYPYTHHRIVFLVLSRNKINCYTIFTRYARAWKLCELHDFLGSGPKLQF